MPSTATKYRPTCAVPTLVPGSSPPVFEPCGQPCAWLVALHGKALNLCDRHVEPFRAYVPLATIVAYDELP